MPSAEEMSPRKWTLVEGEVAAEVLELRAEQAVAESFVEPVQDTSCNGKRDVAASSEGVDGGFCRAGTCRRPGGRAGSAAGYLGLLLGC